ncbi:hypothetical protein [Streptomyces sp. NPDC012825]|uniref:hypothetical protein n=1 Tax=Streptomyces sp. NPDC012825 TaxID=3364851 RepID=UPI00368A1B33
MGTNRMIRKASALAVAVMATGGLVLGTAGPAAAAYHDDGYLEAGELGLYYNSSQLGCVFDLYVYDNNFADNRFRDPRGVNCNGEGQTTNDNVASYSNRWSGTYYVWTDAYRGGIRGSLPGGYSGDATDNFKNKISSSADHI